MRRSTRRGKKRLPVGRILLIVIVAVAVGSIYLATLFGSKPADTGFPYPCATSEGEVLHIHPYIQIIINRQNITLPADIGIVGTSCIEPIHTHDTSGIIHIEAPDITTQYTLGQFFQTWSATYHTVNIGGTTHPITFNSSNILGFKADATHKITLLVDGKPSTEYGSLILNTLDYCSATTTNPPCYPTAVGNPGYNGQSYPFGTGHTIIIEYTVSS